MVEYSTYRCNQCGEFLRDVSKNINKEFIILCASAPTGWVTKKSIDKYDETEEEQPGMIEKEDEADDFHFCGIECLTKFFEKLREERQIKKLKE